jgi:hypothetical protein
MDGRDVRAAVPDARLRLVGKSQPDSLVQAARAAGGGTSCRTVPSMAEEMARAAR